MALASSLGCPLNKPVLPQLCCLRGLWEMQTLTSVAFCLSSPRVAQTLSILPPILDNIQPLPGAQAAVLVRTHIPQWGLFSSSKSPCPDLLKTLPITCREILRLFKVHFRYSLMYEPLPATSDLPLALISPSSVWFISLSKCAYLLSVSLNHLRAEGLLPLSHIRRACPTE